MLRNFIKDTSGQFAVLFVLMSLPLFGISAAVIDYSKINSLQGALQNAADSAAFAAANEIKTSNKRNDAISKLSSAFVHANFEVKEPNRLDLFTEISKDRTNVNVKLIYHWTPIFAHHFDRSLVPMHIEANAKVLPKTSTGKTSVGQTGAKKTSTGQSSGSACRSLLKDRKIRDILKRFQLNLSENQCRAMSRRR